MAEILIKAVDAAHSGSEKDKRGCYKRGDPVVVMPDGHEWGKEERLPKFVVVKIPGLPVATAKKYIQPFLGLPDGKGSRLIVRRRLFRFQLDDVPNSIKQELEDTGEVTVTMSQIRNYIQNKDTLETE